MKKKFTEYELTVLKEAYRSHGRVMGIRKAAEVASERMMEEYPDMDVRSIGSLTQKLNKMRNKGELDETPEKEIPEGMSPVFDVEEILNGDDMEVRGMPGGKVRVSFTISARDLQGIVKDSIKHKLLS